jgi:Asp-tRNA(Asn)/Glu-tRNA(Gln) amidotransferase A subunit family amidase
MQMPAGQKFNIIEATIADVHAAFQRGELTARELVELYLARIDAYDQKGPALNTLISINPHAVEEAAALDAAFKRDRHFVGPLHGIPIIVKDQINVKGMKTTLGSVLFRDYEPGTEGFAIAKLRAAGAIFLGKATLGELGGGDTHGSLFGSTRNVYDLARTAGGSSGGSGASVSANFCTVALGQEGFSSIRRPAAWNGIVGMRPTVGIVSRGGVYGGWPTTNGSVGPMARTVADAAKVLDAMAGYDPRDPVTAYAVGRTPASFSGNLDPHALRGARIGILREPMGYKSEPESDDFNKVDEVFNKAVADLRSAGAEIVDPIAIPDLVSLLATRAKDPAADDAMFELFFADGNAPFKTRKGAMASPLFAKVVPGSQLRWAPDPPEKHHAYLKAREVLMTNLLKVMADHRLDAIVHKAVEHQPTPIEHGIKPPFVDQKGAPHINTFLMFVPSIVVPAGFTRDDLPAGITFLGRPYDDAKMIQLAYCYEQATLHRRAPGVVP